MAKNKKIIRYKKPMNINVGMIIFAVIFVYLSFSVTTYFRRERIQFYEVTEGSIVNDRSYTGLIFREETVGTAPQSGNINYYIREGKRASAGARIYSLDETGQLGRFLEEHQGDSAALSPENLSDLKKKLSNLCLTYTDDRFDAVYNEKYSLQASVAEYMNFNVLDTLESQLQQEGISYQQIYAPQAGIVSYAVDSFDGVSPESVTAESFDRSSYQKNVSKSGSLMEAGTPVYKLITSENWTLVFPLTEQDREEFAKKQTLTIQPSSCDFSLKGNYSQFNGTDGTAFGRLDFDRYMVQFVSDRFMDFEVNMEEAEGLKIPVTSVTSKDFYTIPVGYLTTGGDATTEESGFYKEVYSESGEASIVFTPAEIYNSTEEYYYIDKRDDGPFKSGDYIIKPDSQERFQIGPTASLEGVYNINKGYAVFKLVKTLVNNGEYYIIEKGTSYGLSVYDHIVLDASTVSEGQIVYQ